MVCLIALPAMLVIAMLVQITGFLAGMQRIVFGMPVHEMGHAVTGWLCGFNYIPSLWVTVSSGERGYISSVVVLAALLMLARYALMNKKTCLAYSGRYHPPASALRHPDYFGKYR